MSEEEIFKEEMSGEETQPLIENEKSAVQEITKRFTGKGLWNTISLFILLIVIPPEEMNVFLFCTGLGFAALILTISHWCAFYKTSTQFNEIIFAFVICMDLFCILIVSDLGFRNWPQEMSVIDFILIYGGWLLFLYGVVVYLDYVYVIYRRSLRFQEMYPSQEYDPERISEKDCSICLEDYQNSDSVRILPCQHVYHSPCILNWIKLTPNCPLCRILV